MSILVIDDQPCLRTMLSTFLEDVGYTVVAAAHGREALSYLRHSHELPGLILLDVAMPVMTGWDFLAAQQRDRRLAAIPVIVMTALADMTHAATFPAAVANVYKPLDLDRLLKLITAHEPIPLSASALETHSAASRATTRMLPSHRIQHLEQSKG
jgi:CheY-like chemotaxis protein